jgi:formate hydrogenlyase subunit 6/NADH:ubiquinone oxidoreductase subunit I
VVAATGTGWAWELDDARCVFCGLCVEACPTGALVMSQEFELAVRDRSDLVTLVAFTTDEQEGEA